MDHLINFDNGQSYGLIANFKKFRVENASTARQKSGEYTPTIDTD